MALRKLGDSSGGSDVISGQAGDQLALECVAEGGNPAPSLAWRRADTGEVVARTADLELPAVRRDQAGRYSCRADNAVGQSEAASVEISVQCE